MTADPPSADPTARLAEFLAIGDSPQNFPGVPIRDAATMLVVDHTTPVAKVLMGRRHQGHKFMPGKYVFPGGRVELTDRRMTAATPLDPCVAHRLMVNVRYPSVEKSRGFALAAIREVFEETGIVLGTSHTVTGPQSGTPLHSEPAHPEPARPPSTEWAQFAATGVMPDLAAVHFIARAVTPPGRPRRFDTRFFAVDAAAMAKRIEGVVGPDTELVELVWLPIEDTMKLDMPGITMAVVEELKIRTARGFGHDLPVPFYRMQRGKRVREFLE
jgi:8-oxo-dGTP pyrophosphatase MutT (NUDIX family)